MLIQGWNLGEMNGSWECDIYQWIDSLVSSQLNMISEVKMIGEGDSLSVAYVYWPLSLNSLYFLPAMLQTVYSLPRPSAMMPCLESVY